jgi:hypothetical protein
MRTVVPLNKVSTVKWTADVMLKKERTMTKALMKMRMKMSKNPLLQIIDSLVLRKMQKTKTLHQSMVTLKHLSDKTNMQVHSRRA